MNAVSYTHLDVYKRQAMNTNMYENPILQRNINTLKELGYNFVEPESGRLACGDTGKGKLASPETIVDEVVKMCIRDRGYIVGEMSEANFLLQENYIV